MSLEDTRKKLAQARFEQQMRYRPLWQYRFEQQRRYADIKMDACRPNATHGAEAPEVSHD